MKRQTKMITAFILTLLLILGAPVSAFAGSQEGTFDGTSTVKDVVMNVLVPANLNFALDPLGLAATGGNQIATQDFFFLNQTFAPVKVDVAITATTSGTAVLVATNSAIEIDDVTATDKIVYFGALGATGVTGGSIAVGESTYSAVFGSTTGPAAEYATVSAAAGTLAKATPAAGGASGSALISFALDEAIESAVTEGAIEDIAADNKGVAAFQFYAEMNTYADWQDNDVTVSGTYTLTALRDTTYDELTATGIAGSLNQIVTAAAEPEAPADFSTPGFIIDNDAKITATTRAAINHTKASNDDLTIPFYFGAATITSVVGSNGATPYTLAPEQYTRDAANNQLIFEGSNPAYYIRAIAVGNQTLTITLSTGAVCTVTMVQQ